MAGRSHVVHVSYLPLLACLILHLPFPGPIALRVADTAIVFCVRQFRHPKYPIISLTLALTLAITIAQTGLTVPLLYAAILQQLFFCTDASF